MNEDNFLIRNTADMFTVPEYDNFICKLPGLQFRPLKGTTPNVFHRLMQRLFLGIRWEKLS